MNEKLTPAQRTIALILSILFVALIACFGIHAVAGNADRLIESLKYHKAKKFMTDPDNADFLDETRARFESFQSEVANGLPFKNQFASGNAKMLRLLGKRVISQSKWDMVLLENGQIYALSQALTLREEAEEIVRFRETVSDTPFLFGYITPQFFHGISEMPPEYRGIDTSDELADEVLSIVASAGIDTIDGRDLFVGCGFDDNLLNLKTDMHWTPLAGLIAARTYASEIERLTGIDLDESKLALDRFDTEFYPQYFLGEYAQQIGQEIGGLDDITLYVPKYETSFKRCSIEKSDTGYSTEGSFADAIIHRQMMDGTDTAPSLRAYSAYGLVEREEIIENTGECADMTILIFRDSYTAPIGSFLSLMAKNVIMIDPRNAEHTAAEYIGQYNPDIIIVSFSRQMMEDHDYTLGA